MVLHKYYKEQDIAVRMHELPLTANSCLWLNDTTMAFVCRKNIYIVKVNPVKGSLDIIHNITPENPYNSDITINGAVLDSGGNIWYWTNINPTPVSYYTGTYTLNVESSYSNKKPIVKFEYDTLDFNDVGQECSVNVSLYDIINANLSTGTVHIALNDNIAVFKENNMSEIDVELTELELKKDIIIVIKSIGTIIAKSYYKV